MAKQETKAPVTMAERIAELTTKRETIHAMGGKAGIDKQHAAGKLSARERLALLTDQGSFQEMFAFARHRCTYFGMGDKEIPADGVVTGSGTINGKLIHVASQDFTSAGGATGEVHAEKICEMMRCSLKTGSPMIYINDSGGARIQEGIDSLAGYGRIFYHNTLLSGVVPQIACICGPCAGGAAYSPALMDFIIQTKSSQMFITGPSVIKQVTGEDISAETLGGPEAQMTFSGVVHFIADDDQHAMELCQKLLSFLPSNNMEAPPIREYKDTVTDNPALNEILPDNPRSAYDMHDLIKGIVDHGDFLEVQETFAPNALIGFARITGRPVGIVANQPKVMAGCLDINASDKISRFVRFCNAFNMPIVTLVDTPGFMPGVQQEYGGIIRHGAKMLFSYSASTVPKISIIVRKAYGGAYLAMNAKDLGTDRAAAWPTAEIAVMGAEGAASVVFRKEIQSAEDPKAKAAELVSKYRETFSTPYMAASRRLVDDVIEPASTRRYIAMSLEYLQNKREMRPSKKHGLIPL